MCKKISTGVCSWLKFSETHLKCFRVGKNTTAIKLCFLNEHFVYLLKLIHVKCRTMHIVFMDKSYPLIVTSCEPVNTLHATGKQGMLNLPRHLLLLPMKWGSVFAQGLYFAQHKQIKSNYYCFVFFLLWQPNFDNWLGHDMPNCDKEHNGECDRSSGHAYSS